MRTDQQNPMSLALGMVAVFAVARPCGAADSPQQRTDHDLAKDLKNPVANLTLVPLQTNIEFLDAPEDPLRYTLNIEPVIPIPLNDHPTAETAKALRDELLFQRATQTYLWALPLLNTIGMRDGFHDAYGSSYNVMATWEKRLDAKTHITKPNSDLIYGMVFADGGETGPLAFEAPPKLQGILLDFWQRPIPVDGGKFAGDLGLPGPDGGAGGKLLILPPDYKGEVPEGYYVYRSGTNNVFIFLRSLQRTNARTRSRCKLKQANLSPNQPMSKP